MLVSTEGNSALNQRRFERLVTKALSELPPEIHETMENVAVVVQRNPTAGQLAAADIGPGSILLGLYEGVPLTERTSAYGMILPDKISIFQEPIERICANDVGIIRQVRRTVLHEVAHHFGISDRRLRELGAY